MAILQRLQAQQALLAPGSLTCQVEQHPADRSGGCADTLLLLLSLFRSKSLQAMILQMGQSPHKASTDIVGWGERQQSCHPLLPWRPSAVPRGLLTLHLVSFSCLFSEAVYSGIGCLTGVIASILDLQ